MEVDTGLSDMFSQPNLKSLILLVALFMAAEALAAVAQVAESDEQPANAALHEDNTEDKKNTKKTEPEKANDDVVNPQKEVKPAGEELKEIDTDDEASAEAAEAETAAVARPVSPDPIQVYGWREKILIDGIQGKMDAKLDTGAYTSSIHAEETELFERDGKKWVRFIVTEPRKKNSPRVRTEAPLVRIARIKNPGGESETREVVRLAFKIGERRMRGDFTLNNRSNMLSAVLIGRTAIRELGWIDPSRTNLADKSIMR